MADKDKGLSREDLMKYVKIQSKKIKQRDAEIENLKQQVASGGATESGDQDDTGLVERLKEKEEEVGRLSAKSRQLIKQYKVLQKKLAEATSSAGENGNDAAQSQENADVRAKHADLEAKHTDLEAKHADLEAQHADLEAKHADLEAKHADLEAKHTDTEAKCSSFEATCAELQTQLEAKEEEMESTRSYLMQSKQQVESQLEELQDAHDRVKSENAAHVQRVQQHEGKAEELATRLQEAMESCQHLEQIRTQLGEQNAQLDERVRSLEAELDATRSQLTEMPGDDEIRGLRTQLAEGKDTIQQMQTQIDQAAASQGELSEQHQVVLESIEKLQTENEQLLEDRSRLVQENEQLLVDHEDTVRAMAEHRATEERLVAQVEKHESESLEWTTKVADLEATVLRLEAAQEMHAPVQATHDVEAFVAPGDDEQDDTSVAVTNPEELETLRSVVKALREEIAQQEHELEELRQAAMDVNAKSEAKTAVDESQGVVDGGVQGSHDAYAAAAESHEELRVKHQEEIAQHQDEITQLQDQLGQLRIQLDKQTLALGHARNSRAARDVACSFALDAWISHAAKQADDDADARTRVSLEASDDVHQVVTASPPASNNNDVNVLAANCAMSEAVQSMVIDCMIQGAVNSLCANTQPAIEKLEEDKRKLLASLTEITKEKKELKAKANELAKRYKLMKVKYAKVQEEHKKSIDTTTRTAQASMQSLVNSTESQMEEIKKLKMELAVAKWSVVHNSHRGRSKHVRRCLEVWKLRCLNARLVEQLDTATEKLVLKVDELVTATQERERQQKRVAELEGAVKDLQASNDAHARAVTDSQTMLLQLKQAPRDFALDAVLARVSVNGASWCCVKTADGSRLKPPMGGAPTLGDGDDDEATGQLEWHEEANVLRWLKSINFEYDETYLPEWLHTQYHRDASEKIHAMESKMANMVMETQETANEFAQYKRKAQVALKKAKADSAGSTDRRINDLESTIEQLQSELSRVSQERDVEQCKVEEELATKAGLLGSIRELEARVAELEQEVTSAREHAEADARVALEDAVARSKELEADTQKWEARASQLEDELVKAKEAVEAAELGVEQRRGLMEKLQDDLEASNASVASLNVKLKEAKLELQVAEEEHKRQLKLASHQVPQPQDGMLLQQHLGNGGLPAVDGGKVVTLEAASADKAPAERQERESRSGQIVSADSTSGTGAIQGDESASLEQDDEMRSMLRSNSVVSNVTSAVHAGEEGQHPSFFAREMDAMKKQHTEDRKQYQMQVMELQQELEDCETEKGLFQEQIKVLKEQFREMERKIQRKAEITGESVEEEMDHLTYLKNVVFKFMAAEDATEKETLLPVISMLLKFSPEELARVKAVLDRSVGGDVVGWAGGLLGWKG